MQSLENKVVTHITLYTDASTQNRPSYVYAKQYDANSRYLVARIVDSGSEIAINGTVQLNAIKPDGTHSYIEGTVNEDGTVTIGLTANLLAVEGVVSCDISVIDSSNENNTLLTTSAFFIVVDKSNYDADAIESTDEFVFVAGVLNKIITARDEAVAAAEEARSVLEGVGQLPTADNVRFPSDVLTAYPVGNVTLQNGIGVMARAGDSVTDLFRNVWFKVMQPTVTFPSLSVTFSGSGKEVGESIFPTYNAIFDAGEYSFGPATGVQATAWRASDTEGNSSASSADNFSVLLTDETAYRLTVECDHTGGAQPLTNEGNPATVTGITAGTVKWTSSVIKGYRNSFYGAFTQADLDSFERAESTQSQIIRALTKSGKTLSNGSSFTVTIPAGAKQVVFAYPATLRAVTSIKDVNGMNAEIKSSFALSTISVEGANGYTAIPYKVYVLDYANAVETANTYIVTI